MGIVSRLGRRVFGVCAQQLDDEFERVHRVVHLRERLEQESIQRLYLFRARLPTREVLLDLVEIARQVLKILHLLRALGQVNEYCVAVFARRDEAMEQVAQASTSINI